MPTKNCSYGTGAAQSLAHLSPIKADKSWDALCQYDSFLDNIEVKKHLSSSTEP